MKINYTIYTNFINSFNLLELIYTKINNYFLKNYASNKYIIYKIIILIAVYTIFLTPLISNDIIETDLPSKKSTSFMGRRFMVGFMQNELNRIQSMPVQLKLFFAATKPANVKIKFPDGSELQNFVPANGVSIRNISEFYESSNSEVIERKGIEVISDEEIMVYGYCSQYTTSDIYTAIPISALGNEYRTVNMPNDFYSPKQGESIDDIDPSNTRSRPGEFLVIANEDNTIVDITPYARTYRDKQPLTKFTITLNKFESYLVQSYPTPKVKRVNDLTGSLIKSNKPVTVLSGHTRTASPQVDTENEGDSKDHIIEMMPPISAWGQNYLTVPFGGIGNTIGTMYKIVSHLPNTIISATTDEGTLTYNLDNPGNSLMITEIEKSAKWSSNKPFLLTQFMSRANAENRTWSLFDPSFSLISPINQYINSAIFRTPRNNFSNFRNNEGFIVDQYSYHKCMIICEDEALDYLTINGGLIKNLNQTYKVGQLNSGYNFFIIDLVENATYKIESKLGKFTGVMYGGGSYDSYSNPLGALLNNKEIVDNEFPKYNFKDECGNIFVTITDSTSTDTGIKSIEILNTTKNFKWVIDTLSENSKIINFTASPIDRGLDGIIEIEVYDKNGNGKKLTYNYKGINISQLKYINTGDLYHPDTTCIKYKIKNESDNEINLISISEPEFNGLKLKHNLTFPFQFKAKDSIEIELCLNTSLKTKSILERIEFNYDCNLKNILVLESNFILPSLLGEEKDLGIIRVGDTLCTDLTWENNGDLNLNITGLNYFGLQKDFGKTIFFDTLGFFPKIIKVGESLTIKNICIVPDSVKNFTFNFTLKNNLNVQNTGIIYAQGGAPNIQIIDLDWDTRRVGTFNDTIITITNTGNLKGKVNFIKNTNSRLDNKLEKYFNDLGEIELNPNETINLELEYFPTIDDYNGFNYSYDLDIDWQFHPKTTFNITAKSSMPQILTRTINMGKCEVFKEKKGIDSLMFNVFGNENLTVDIIEIISGDKDAFELSNNYNESGVYPIDYQRLIDINFKPTFVGNHILKIGVLNDGLPNYYNKVDTVYILGEGIPGDTLDFELSINKSDIYACDSTELTITIKNTGNVDINVNNIDIISDNFESWAINNISNRLLKQNESLEFKIGMILERLQEGNIDFDVNLSYQKNIYDISVLTDTTIKLSKYIKPIVYQLISNDIKDINLIIGDTTSFDISGKFPFDIDKNIEFKLKMNLNIYDVKLMNNFTYLIIKSDGKFEQIPVNIIQTETELIFNIVNKDIYIGKDAEWSMNLIVKKLLTSNIKIDFTLYLESEKCFDPNVNNFFGNVEDICVFNLRTIEFIAKLKELKVAPNPISFFGTIEFELRKDEELVKFEVFSINGEKILNFEKINLKKGLQSIIFEITELPTNNYILVIHTSNFVKQTFFTVNK